MSVLREQIFNSAIERSFFSWYRKIFSIQEIEESRVLQWVFGAMIFAHYIVFNSWTGAFATTVDAFAQGEHTCWPFFQSCGELLFLRTLPNGYSQTTWYMLLFGSLVLCVYLIYRRDWVLAHLVLAVSFVWHALVTFVLSASLIGNYEYYLFIFTLILLFLPHKTFFLQLSVVFFYVLSTVAKIHETWVLGTYFSAMRDGLPIFPKWSIPLWTNLVIAMEMIGSWFLMGKRGITQRVVFLFFVTFHLYSGILVGYRYPATVLPTLFILFGPLYEKQRVPLDRKALVGWILIISMLFLQFLPRMIPGDEKLTLEGNHYGLYMFEANHQCMSIETIYYRDGRQEEKRSDSTNARNRCDPYRGFFRLKMLCERNRNIARIAWTFDHSINGNPFLRIVDVPDVCVLEYKPFSHNEWIKTHADNPQVIGRPVENVYY